MERIKTFPECFKPLSSKTVREIWLLTFKKSSPRTRFKPLSSKTVREMYQLDGTLMYMNESFQTLIVKDSQGNTQGYKLQTGKTFYKFQTLIVKDSQGNSVRNQE